MQKKKTKKEAVVHNKEAVVWNVLSRIAWQLQCIYTVSDYWVLQDEIDGSWGWWCLPSADLFMANRRLQHPVNGELSQHAVCFTFWRTVWVVEEHETWFFFCQCLWLFENLFKQLINIIRLLGLRDIKNHKSSSKQHPARPVLSLSATCHGSCSNCS